jgi:hypothetical protein
VENINANNSSTPATRSCKLSFDGPAGDGFSEAGLNTKCGNVDVLNISLEPSLKAVGRQIACLNDVCNPGCTTGIPN